MDRALMFAIHICYFHLSLFIFCIFIIVLLYLQLHKLLKRVANAVFIYIPSHHPSSLTDNEDTIAY